jgi:hypothetical protein
MAIIGFAAQAQRKLARLRQLVTGDNHDDPHDLNAQTFIQFPKLIMERYSISRKEFSIYLREEDSSFIDWSYGAVDSSFSP